MATEVHLGRGEGVDEQPRNRVLIGLIGLSVEFWIVVGAVLADAF
jgi:hypothetical protein